MRTIDSFGRPADAVGMRPVTASAHTHTRRDPSVESAEEAQPRRSASRRRGLIGAASVLLVVVGLSAAQPSMAAFIGQDGREGSTSRLVVQGQSINTLPVTLRGMMPGDSLTQPVVLHNEGTAQLLYAVSTATTDPDGKSLRDVLTLTIKTIDATTPADPCDDFDGTTLLPSVVLGASRARLGDPRTGADAGDRTLAGGASETLCYRISLQLSAGNEYQGATASAALTLQAEEAATNP